MKLRVLFVSAVSTLVFGHSSLADVSDWRIALVESAGGEKALAERGPHHRLWQRDNATRLNDGRVVPRRVRVVEYATGLHYFENGEWKESQDEIEIVADGAAATQGRHKVHFAGNANTFGAVAITTPDNKVLTSHVLGLLYTDRNTGQSVWVAQIQDSIGLLFPPNQILYPDALAGNGMRADIRYSYTRSGVEQDVILRADSALPPPHSFNLNDETTFLEVCTEWVNPPEPSKTERVVGGLSDQMLDFGTMRMVHGSVFALDAPMNRMSGAPVYKQWLEQDNRTFLIESVPYRLIRDDLANLVGGIKGAAIKPAAEASRMAVLFKTPSPAGSESGPVQMALNRQAFDSRKGLVLDYVLCQGDYDDITFQADTTYHQRDSQFFWERHVRGKCRFEVCRDQLLGDPGLRECHVQIQRDRARDIYEPQRSERG